MDLIWYESCCFQIIRSTKFYERADSKCWNCGEDCFDATSQGLDSAVVQVRYIIEKKQVGGDCYQILRELDDLS